ncbi:hypothetical protein Thena_0453 [Thermodesulfobium narugense DSM 14796]|uniref:NHL repeat containing protein n=1 Tax=Thermodesulfobium narugense DSM 14796 TaxID=747365 RepID=M1E6C2_9BACT|nr:hypothetical protein [Thermodesulfobium narugense]AEE14093.1 hypothetical protein Thena_0453 [Thermodesulfobium narugense DSM 14796]
MKKYWSKILIIAVSFVIIISIIFVINFKPSKTLSNSSKISDDSNTYLFYKCNPNGELEFKNLYFYTQNEQDKKISTIESLQQAGYKNLGGPDELLIKDSRGFVTSTKTINLSCKIRDFTYNITVGAMTGNPNPVGQCGAFSSHWIEIEKGNSTILPKTVLQTCNSQSAISKITINSAGQIQVYKTNPYSQSGSANPMDTNKKRTIYVGQTPDAIATDNFGNIWVSNYQSQNIAKINQDGEVDLFNLKGSPTNIAVDSYGNVFVIVEDSIIKLTQEGKIIGTYKIADGLNYIFIDPQNNVWVDDWKDGKIFKLNENGNITKTYQASYGAYQIIMDKSNNLWVASSYGPLILLYPNGHIKECSQCCVNKITTANNTAWITTGKLLDNSIMLRHINANCEILPQSYKLNIQPTGIAIDNKDNIWISGNKKEGEGVLEEISESEMHVYLLGKFPGPLVIDKYNNIWVISGTNTVTEFYKLANNAQTKSSENPTSGLNPHLPIAIHHTFPENIGK